MNYKKFYEWYHRDRKLPRRIISNKNFTYRIIISVLDKYCTSKEVFDVGSGVGTLDFYLANQGKQITGIEISDRAFKIALKSQKKFKLEQRINFIRTDFYRYKSNKTYNFVICSEVLEHLKDDKPALEKISKFVKKGGLLLLTVPSSNAPLKYFGVIKAFDKRSGHLRRYSMSQIIPYLSNFGFKVIFKQKSEGIIRNALFFFKWGNPIIRVANKFAVISDFITFMDNISLKLFGESQIIVIAKKI